MLTVPQIQAIIPHRYPFLLVDRIVEIEPMKRAVGIKNVTANEQFFQGHFPGKPIMPGVLLLEAMAQVGGVAMLHSDEFSGKLAVFAGIDRVKFRRPVVPGDQVRMVAEIMKMRGTMGKIWAEAFVDGELVAEGEFLFALT
ncbi:3-hydroxyacyl-ACP dehydratase FabZ [Anaeroselena agilis]|uniref:3-hydroxyacyl-[acyl-carrier-protein] dehydratase FabZ n=1 Tax=Anaeroselena agilis TaxID=3063788 RepID=A0ABU3P425_9FIRM|nr:3-hydroxyacyl-ACP dehydratase FabZ [Selenomonadales bacterium 4137-cl]